MKKLLLSLTVIALVSPDIKAQTIELFNGKDLSNWNFVLADDKVAPQDVFSVRDGVILIQGEPFGYMYTKETYSDYVLEVEWSWPEKATNSGIFLLIAEAKNPFPNGIECQLKAGNAGDLVLLGGADLAEYKQPAGERPAFPVISKQKASSEKPLGQWNKAKIEVKNGIIVVYINGQLQNKGANKIKKGYIGLQSEGGPIRFRNVRLTNILER
ncbi:MAG: DUF1080 domain-containing protein [Tannerella sp.]|jgi:hypothetical protein|nr:DUF1080 domain-containing protein [Tannerella sp.]